MIETIVFIILFVWLLGRGERKERAKAAKKAAAERKQEAANADEVMDAFYKSFKDGSSSLHGALPDDMLVDYYDDILEKVAHDGNTDPVAFANSFSEMTLLHTEIATRFTRRVRSEQSDDNDDNEDE